jgi:hypothetical protein
MEADSRLRASRRARPYQKPPLILDRRGVPFRLVSTCATRTAQRTRTGVICLDRMYRTRYLGLKEGVER